jgi:hypothetical protein
MVTELLLEVGRMEHHDFTDLPVSNTFGLQRPGTKRSRRTPPTQLVLTPGCGCYNVSARKGILAYLKLEYDCNS